ncbi:hypothetical protein SAMN05444165_4164 [Paraburkholderia phenazinium]|uniref:Uncharacterized protein n=1 Tax=Paraburkholderia phenazinium TaxID=60549 RepID=A0A1N6KPN5_9BURK|nr:hypothetical protein SAMN05444165_4164 [Paraburkholderia phenazinium]
MKGSAQSAAAGMLWRAVGLRVRNGSRPVSAVIQYSGLGAKRAGSWAARPDSGMAAGFKVAEEFPGGATARGSTRIEHPV